MAKYGKQRKRKSDQDTRAVMKDAERRSSYIPPSRHECVTDHYSYILDEHHDLQITIHVWYQKGAIVDFYGAIEQIDSNNKVVETLASMDCKNHGTIHAHNELLEPEHKQRRDIYVLNSVTDIDKYFDRAIDALIDYAASIKKRGGLL